MVDAILRPAELTRRLKEVMDSNLRPSGALTSLEALLSEANCSQVYVGQHPEFMGVLEVRDLVDIAYKIQCSITRRRFMLGIQGTK